jgi:hypothetical protein
MLALKYAAACRGGAMGGAIAAIALAVVIRLLQPSLLPWFSVPAAYRVDRALDWLRAMAVIVPIGIALGIGAAFASALVFEYLTRRATWHIGALVGLSLGLVGAAALGLMPLVGWELGLSYTPPVAPLGPGDPSSVLAAVAAAGTFVGMVAGVCYGVPLHAGIEAASPRWRELHSKASELQSRAIDRTAGTHRESVGHTPPTEVR